MIPQVLEAPRVELGAFVFVPAYAFPMFACFNSASNPGSTLVIHAYAFLRALLVQQYAEFDASLN